MYCSSNPNNQYRRARWLTLPLLFLILGLTTSPAASQEDVMREGSSDERPPLQSLLMAVEESEGEAKFEAVTQLWYRAADLGVPEEALQNLRLATNDPDPRVAEQAQQAVADLERFRETLRAATERQ